MIEVNGPSLGTTSTAVPLVAGALSTRTGICRGPLDPPDPTPSKSTEDESAPPAVVDGRFRLGAIFEERHQAGDAEEVHRQTDVPGDLDQDQVPPALGADVLEADDRGDSGRVNVLNLTEVEHQVGVSRPSQLVERGLEHLVVRGIDEPLEANQSVGVRRVTPGFSFFRCDDQCGHDAPLEGPRTGRAPKSPLTSGAALEGAAGKARERADGPIVSRALRTV